MQIYPNLLNFIKMRTTRRQKYYLIPVELATLVFRERLEREFQIWLLLKHWSNGRIEITPPIINALAAVLDTSGRSVYRALTRLRDRNWIGYNTTSGLSYVRGLDTLRIIEQCNGRGAVWFDVEAVRTMEGFVAGVAFAELIRRQKVKFWREAAGAQKKGGATQPAPLPKFYPVAIRAIEKIFGVSRSTVARAKKAAVAAGFLLIQRGKPTPIHTDNPGAFLRGFPEMEGRLFHRGGQWLLRGTDGAQTTLQFKRRSRIKKQPKNVKRSFSNYSIDKNGTILKGDIKGKNPDSLN